MQSRETVASVIDRILKGEVPAEVRRKPGRLIIRTTLPDSEGRARTVFIKVHTRKAWWDRRGSAAEVERVNFEWACSRGIPVPRLISEFEYASFDALVTEELSGMSALHDLIPTAVKALSGRAFRVWKRELADEVARLARLLHESDRFHKDLYLCHFFLPDQAMRDRLPLCGRLHLLDFLRLKHHRWNRRRWQVKDLAELLYSSDLPGLDTRDRLRFMHSYLGCRKLDPDARRLVRSVERKAARYRRQNRGR